MTEWKDIPLPNDKLLPGLQAPSNSGQQNVDMLYYYEPLLKSLVLNSVL